MELVINFELFIWPDRVNFVECVAFDGLFLSNTLTLERDHNWTGLLVEASPETFKNLLPEIEKPGHLMFV